MLINISNSDLEFIRGEISGSIGADVSDRLGSELALRYDPLNRVWVERAKKIHQKDGWIEIDEQSDGSSLVSISDDGGAYVAAWVWVPDES